MIRFDLGLQPVKNQKTQAQSSFLFDLGQIASSGEMFFCEYLKEPIHTKGLKQYWHFASANNFITYCFAHLTVIFTVQKTDKDNRELVVNIQGFDQHSRPAVIPGLHTVWP